MFQIIIGVSLFIVAISIYTSYQSGSSSREGILLGVLLPSGVHKKLEVVQLVKNYKRGNTILFFVFIALTIPLFIIEYTSFILLYMGSWCIVYFMMEGHYYKIYFIELLLLKSKNKWFPNDYEYHILATDSTDSKPKNILCSFYRKLLPSTKDKILAMINEPVYVDEDEYWINGYYYNPDDRRSMVEKRIGFGSTLNMASRRSQITAITSAIFGVALACGLLSLFFMMDFVTFQMSIQGDIIRIDAPVYDYQFEAVDIKDISLTEELPPNGIRTNGAATSTYYLGNFNIDEYGSSKVFVYIKNPPFIIIRLEDMTVIFNAKAEEETVKYYNLLVDLMENDEELGKKESKK